MKNFSTVSKAALFRILNPSIISIPKMPGKRQIKKIEKYRKKYESINYISNEIPVYDLKIVLAQFCGEQFLKTIQLQDHHNIYYPDLEKINEAVAEIHSRPIEKIAKYSPFKEKTVNVLPEGRIKHNRASKMTILTYLAINMLISDKTTGTAENITLSRIAEIVGTTRNTVHRSLNWLRDNDFIYSDCYFAGVFDVTIFDSMSDNLYKTAINGGKGFLEINVDLFNYIKKLHMSEIRVILTMLYYMPSKAHKKVILTQSELKNILPPYISFNAAFTIMEKVNDVLGLTDVCSYDKSEGVIELSAFTGKNSSSEYRESLKENCLNSYIELLKADLTKLYGFEPDLLTIDTCIEKDEQIFRIFYKRELISSSDVSLKLGQIFNSFIEYDSDTSGATLSVILRINNSAWTSHYGFWCGTSGARIRFEDSPILNNINYIGVYYERVASTIMRLKGISKLNINSIIKQITNEPEILFDVA